MIAATSALEKWLGVLFWLVVNVLLWRYLITNRRRLRSPLHKALNRNQRKLKRLVNAYKKHRDIREDVDVRRL